MRACLAILIDSFREAAASRVLLIALLAIVVVLVALSPLGLTTSVSTQLRPFELIDTERFLRSLMEGKRPRKPPPPICGRYCPTNRKKASRNG